MLKFINYRKKTKEKIDWQPAPDVKKRVDRLLDSLGEETFLKPRIFCFRSTSAKTRAIARIWGFPRIWQLALKQKPAYIIEVISEKFDCLSERQKDEDLLHEIAHIPANFSGSLVPHIRHGKRNFYIKVGKLIKKSFDKK